MDILSFHSRVAWGYVGNSIAVPVIQHFGLNAWPVDTVTLGHHPGHGPSFRRVADVRDIIELGRDVVQHLDSDAAALIGYLGNVEQGQAINTVLLEAKGSGKNFPIYLDPVFGDDKEGVYVDEEIIGYFKDVAIPISDVVMPNCFELARLTDTKINNISDAVQAAQALLKRGPSIVLASSIPDKNGTISNILVTHEHNLTISVPKVNLAAKGTGDLLSATFMALHMSGLPVKHSFQRAIKILQCVIDDASSKGLNELNLPYSLTLAETPLKQDDLHIDEV